MTTVCHWLYVGDQLDRSPIQQFARDARAALAKRLEFPPLEAVIGFEESLDLADQTFVEVEKVAQLAALGRALRQRDQSVVAKRLLTIL